MTTIPFKTELFKDFEYRLYKDKNSIMSQLQVYHTAEFDYSIYIPYKGCNCGDFGCESLSVPIIILKVRDNLKNEYLMFNSKPKIKVYRGNELFEKLSSNNEEYKFNAIKNFIDNNFKSK